MWPGGAVKVEKNQGVEENLDHLVTHLLTERYSDSFLGGILHWRNERLKKISDLNLSNSTESEKAMKLIFDLFLSMITKLFAESDNKVKFLYKFLNFIMKRIEDR